MERRRVAQASRVEFNTASFTASSAERSDQSAADWTYQKCNLIFNLTQDFCRDLVCTIDSFGDNYAAAGLELSDLPVGFQLGLMELPESLTPLRRQIEEART